MAFLILVLGVAGIYYFNRDSGNKTSAKTAQPKIAQAQTSRSTVLTAPLKQYRQKTKQPESEPQQFTGPIIESDPCWEKLQAQAEDPQKFFDRIAPETNQIIGAWFFDKSLPITPTENPSVTDVFNRGVAAAGLLAGSEAKENADEAIRLLMRAHVMDPENSAPLLIAAYVEDRRGRTAEAEAYIAQAREQSKRFKSYYGELLKAALRRVESPSDYMAAQKNRSGHMILDTYTFGKYLKEKKAYEFGEQLVADCLDESNKIEFVDCSPLEYSAGLGLIRLAGGGDRLPQSSEMLSLKQSQNILYRHEAFNRLQYNCELDVLEDFVIDLKSHLN